LTPINELISLMGHDNWLYSAPLNQHIFSSLEENEMHCTSASRRHIFLHAFSHEVRFSLSWMLNQYVSMFMWCICPSGRYNPIWCNIASRSLPAEVQQPSKFGTNELSAATGWKTRIGKHCKSLTCTNRACNMLCLIAEENTNYLIAQV